MEYILSTKCKDFFFKKKMELKKNGRLEDWNMWNNVRMEYGFLLNYKGYCLCGLANAPFVLKNFKQ